ncbi:MAG: hypothetical protein AAGA64_06370 [Bacteroidota bacterium]
MSQQEESGFFWPSFADLMTSLFFVMLVLYVITVVILKEKENAIEVKAKQYERILEIEQALANLDEEYFEYNEGSKRYRLKIDVQFSSGSSNIYELDRVTLNRLRDAGNSLRKTLKEIISENPNVNYLLIVEGNTQISTYKNGPYQGLRNIDATPNVGYILSYERALALSNYWKSKDIDFAEIENCEIMLVGSGYYGKSRDRYNEENNRKFSIQITAKVGDLVE